MIVELVGGPGDGDILEIPDRETILYELAVPSVEVIFRDLYDECLRNNGVAPVSPPIDQVIYRWTGQRRADGARLFHYVP